MITTAKIDPPDLRVATLDDYDRIVPLEKANGMSVMPRSDWEIMWLKNPLWPEFSKSWPIGWVLEDADRRLVGSLVNIPRMYKFRGRDLVCAVGRSWVVEPDYRGFALWLMSEYYDQAGVDLFVNTTVAAVAEP